MWGELADDLRDGALIDAVVDAQGAGDVFMRAGRPQQRPRMSQRLVWMVLEDPGSKLPGDLVCADAFEDFDAGCS